MGPEPDVVYPKTMNGPLKTALALGLLTLGLCGSQINVKPVIASPFADVIGTSCEAPPPEFHDQVLPLADLISKGEGDWNAVNRGWAGDTPGGIQRLTGKTFDQFTVGQVMDMQRRWLFAVGRYQFIPRTLRFAVSKSDVKTTDKFTPETQNRLFAALLEHKRPEVGAYLRGEHDSLNAALRGLAKEWASVEYFGWGGRGYYNHIGGNRAHISWEDAAAALKKVREKVTT